MKSTQVLIAASILSVFSAIASADTGKFKVEGMHCGACAKTIEAKVCAMEGLSECTVKKGSISLSTKPGVAIDVKKLESLVTEAGDEYKITKSEIKKSEGSAKTTEAAPAPAKH